MPIAIPLHHVGMYLVAELVRARDAFASAPDGGPFATLRSAELSIAFASADGLPVEPALVSPGEGPMTPAEAAQRLGGLDRPVLVAREDVMKAKAAARGRLVLRVVLPGA